MTSLLAKTVRGSMPRRFFITGGVNRRDSLLAVQRYALFFNPEDSPMDFPVVADVRWNVVAWWLRRICNPPQLSIRIL